MRIAFVDHSGWDFHAESADQFPMGGSQSAACHLSRSLARIGHDVVLLSNTSVPGRHGEVECLPVRETTAAQLRELRLDVMVSVLAAGRGQHLRNMVGPDVRLVLWNQHAHDQPGVQALREPSERDAYDGYAMVSEWQREQYAETFGLDRSRTVVLRNAIGPAFCNLFVNDRLILANKPWPPIIAYTSTPYRGLGRLLDEFPKIREAVRGTRLLVFSSMKVYQVGAEADTADYGGLYDRCRATDGVEYIGSLPQPELAVRLRSATLLAYPNTFAETSCIAVLEAMAGGCRIVTSRLGALPETTAGFGRLVSAPPGEKAYLPEFTQTVIRTLRECVDDRFATECLLRAQVDKVNAADTWPVRAYEWTQWLRSLTPRPPYTGSSPDQTTVEQLFSAALKHHQSGRMPEAEKLYVDILSREAEHAYALHYLGVIRHQGGKSQEAIDLIRRSIKVRPDDPEAYYNLGIALKRVGESRESIETYRRAIEIDPKYVKAYNNLSVLLLDAGELDEAAATSRKAIELKPDYTEAYNNLGNILKDMGRLDQAVEAFRQSIALQPDSADGHNNLAAVLNDRGEVEAAIAGYRRALALRPGFAEAQNNLGVALKNNRQLDEAIAAGRQAVALHPDYAAAYNNLGNALKENGQLDEAIEAYHRVVALEPENPDGHSNLANALKDKGQIDQCVAEYRRAISNPAGSSHAHGNLLFALQLHPGYDAATIAEEMRAWERRYAAPLSAFVEPHVNDHNSERRLRIGYVSPDFRSHVVGRNLLPLFLRHDHTRFEITCYAQVPHTDALTEQFKTTADRWRPIVGRSDAEVAAQVREDGIDILVDLALHTAHNRLMVFARKPAPIQVTFAGYPGTTGLRAIDYRLSDPYLDPEGMDESVYSERTVRLPNSFWCYDPFEFRDIEVGPPPAKANGFVTFGCLNNFCKINDQVIALWARVLREVDRSRLLLLAGVGGHRQATLDLFARDGIDPGRIEFIPRQSARGYLKLYDRIDLGLDTFPYNGHTTTLDSCWMGVPVVTIVGQRAVARAGWCHLSNLGFSELAGRTADEFVRIAVDLARDLPRLETLRSTLRPKMETSPLMDAERFTRGIESAYLCMWNSWCEGVGRAADIVERPSTLVAHDL